MGDSPNIATFYTEDQPRDLGYFEPIPNGFVGIMPPVIPNPQHLPIALPRTIVIPVYQPRVSNDWIGSRRHVQLL